MVTTVESAGESSTRTGAKGQKVGAYTLLDPIGRGGMGEVWRARHDLLGRLAAVKLIRPESASALSSGDEARKRFEREARATSALRSPHTIAIYDFGFTDEHVFYYAMELLDGFSLDVLVERFGEVSPARAVHLLRGACESLTEAHARGLIHRDIKPANVFTSRMGIDRDFAKVLDFGLVKHVVSDGLTSLTAEGSIPGSPAFLAPESAKGDLTAKADVYSLGCVAYWLVAANYVFKGATALEMMIGHCHVQPKPPSERTLQSIPRALDELVMDCLKKEPAERPTMKEVSERLAVIAASHPWSSMAAEAWWTEHHPAAAEIVEPLSSPGWSEAERARRIGEGVDRLQRHFEKSHFDVTELDRRILLIKKAADEHALAAVFAGLPSLALPAPLVGAAAQAMVKAEPGAFVAVFHHPVVSVMSSFVRRFDLVPGMVVKGIAVLGSTVLDFRGSIRGPGVVEARCVVVMGSIEVIVPPGVRVLVESSGFWGVVEQSEPVAPPDPDSPTLRVIGVVVMGSIEVKVMR